MTSNKVRNTGLGSSSRSVSEAIRIFATGRAAGLLLGLVFQLLTVRLLSLSEYVTFVTVAAVALLLQWGFLFGLPRLISRIGGQYIANHDRAGLWRFLTRVLAARAAVILVGALIAAIGILLPVDWLEGVSLPLVAATLGWSVSLTLQADTEAAGQVLMQQRLGRIVALVEPTLRILGLVALAALAPAVTGTAVATLSAVTSGLAAAALAGGVFVWRARTDDQPPTQTSAPTFGAMARMALAGHSSSLGALFVSPAAVRLVAAANLPAEAYAAFAFVQSLVSSAIRFTPSLMMTALIEPLVMTDVARTRSTSKLEAGLGLLLKVELLFWCPFFAALVAAGPAVIDLLSGGRFESYYWLLPGLFPLLLFYGLYRSFETAAFAIGAAGILGAAILIGVSGLALLVLTAPLLGLGAVIAVPYAEAAVRLLFVGRGIHKAGIIHIFDWLAVSAAAIATIVIGGTAATLLRDQSSPVVLAGGAAAGLLTGIVILAMRPLRTTEANLFPYGSVVGSAAQRISRDR